MKWTEIRPRVLQAEDGTLQDGTAEHPWRPMDPAVDFVVKLRCAICGSTEGVRQFAVTVDGDELRAVALLCAEHGDAHLLNVGRVLGSLFARVGDPVVDCGEPAPVGASRCIRGQGHTGDHVASPLEGWGNVQSMMQNEAPSICPSCRNPTSEPRRVLGKWTWDCSGGCNP